MRRFFLRAGLFLLLTLGVLGALEWGTRQAIVEHTDLKYEAVFSGTERLSSVILGPSSTMAIDPRSLVPLGLNAYNLSFAGSSPEFLRRWYGVFREVQGRPTTVVLSADWFLFKEKYAVRTLEVDAEYLPPGVLFRLLLDRDTDIGRLAANALGFVKNRQLLKDALFLQRRAPERPDYHRGFRPFVHQPYKQAWVPASADAADRVQAYEALLSQLRRDGARVVMVQMPQYLPRSGDHPREYANFARIARAHGVPYLNYNTTGRTTINEDAGLFLDWVHMNEAGTRRFGERLQRDLAALGWARPSSAAPNGR